MINGKKRRKEEKKKHEKLQHINVHVNSRLIHGRCLIDQLPFYQGGHSGNLGSNDIKVVSGVCAGSRVKKSRLIKTVLLVMIRSKLFTVFFRL